MLTASAAAAVTAAIVGIYTIHKFNLPENLLPQNQVAERVTTESQPQTNVATTTMIALPDQPKHDGMVATPVIGKTLAPKENLDNEWLENMEYDVADLKQITSKEPSITPIADISPSPLEIANKIRSNAFQEKEMAPNVNPSTAKVYTLANIAGLGLKRLAGLVGISYNVKNDSTNTSKHIEVDSKLIAISTTIRKND